MRFICWLILGVTTTLLACGCPVSAECQRSTECDDQNGCTDDDCLSGSCVHKSSSAACDDGNSCSEDDHCLAGSCTGTVVACADENPCTDDSCDPALGCQFTPNTAACDDGNACTEGDLCAEGYCGGAAVVCADVNPCTDDSCDSLLGCQYAFNTASCNDGNACTEGDTCAGGACQGSTVACDDANQCTEDRCDPVEGCLHQDTSASCTDGSDCTTDGCDPGAGCRFTYRCHAKASCVELHCVCNPGYRGDGLSCSDVNECREETHECAANANCTNTAGSYTCRCLPGYTGDGFTCTPIACDNDGICDLDEDCQFCPGDCRLDLAVIVDSDLLPGIEPDLQQYLADLAGEGKKAYLLPFTGVNAADLRSTIQAEQASFCIGGAFLVGDLPAAWYEQTAFDTWEEFPCDIYLMALSSSWVDANGNGRFDSHGSLDATVFVSRLMGSRLELQSYFDRLHAYRTTGSLAPNTAYVFTDDDWIPWAGTAWGLDAAYASCELCYDIEQSTRATYIAKVTGSGAEFVYQWIHSDPQTLYVVEDGAYNPIYASEIPGLDPLASFYNLFDCSAARFTERVNFAKTYVVHTSRGLAAIGSTKTGGIYNPEVFHADLAAGSTWGAAFLDWYGIEGRLVDEWFLGIVITGDPMLTLSGGTRAGLRALPSPAWTPEQVQQLRQTLSSFARQVRLGTFEEYRRTNPRFFGE